MRRKPQSHFVSRFRRHEEEIDDIRKPTVEKYCQFEGVSILKRRLRVLDLSVRTVSLGAAGEEPLHINTLLPPPHPILYPSRLYSNRNQVKSTDFSRFSAITMGNRRSYRPYNNSIASLSRRGEPLTNNNRKETAQGLKQPPCRLHVDGTAGNVFDLSFVM